MGNVKFFVASCFVLALFACDSGPKVIEADASEQATNTPIFGNPTTGHVHEAPSTAEQGQPAEHRIVAEEILNTDKYTYVRAKEGDQENWIAISKRDVQKGGHYVYSGGLMKKNFMSKEFNRVFETVYLVSDFREEGTSGAPPAAGGNIPEAKDALEAPKSLKPAPGAIRIADLVANLAKYEGKMVKVTGKCVKVNPMIMGRNWVHLQDGSGKDLDLTVTTMENVALGSIVTLEGTIALNKDFGAGYKYGYIMEAATLK